MPAKCPPPHAERLTRRIDALQEPLVQVWGWPGSGRTALLEALLQSERSYGLALGELATERDLKGALDAARAVRARRLIASACPEERIAAAARWLRPGERLIFSTERRYRAAVPCALVAPQELLLNLREVASLWHLLTGSELEPDAARRLREASDGWYFPLCLALEATGGAGLASGEEEALLAVPEVRSFLRHQVLDALDEPERELLLSWAAPQSWLGEGSSPALRRLVESRGLWVEGADGERPPRLLAAYLARHQRRRHAPAAAAPAAPPAAVLAAAPPPVEPGQPVYSLGLLGEPVAHRRDGESARELGWRLRRSFQVLAFLASSPGLQAGREDLIEAVWPKEGERTIDRNFHPTLSHLRRALEGTRGGGGLPPLLFHGGVYRLNPKIAWEIDLLEFRRLIDEGRALLEAGERAPAAEAWKRAWKLYRGPFLQGHYETWVGPRREEYQRLYLDLLRELGDLEVRLARPAEAMDAYRSVLVEDPLQERVHVAVMRLYAEQGRRDLVRRQYDRLCTLLLEELGVEPLPATTKEYHQLMV